MLTLPKSPQGTANSLIEENHGQGPQNLDDAWAVIQQQKELIGSLNLKLAEVSLTDSLTGLPNEKAFKKRFSQEVFSLLRYPSNLSLLRLELEVHGANNSEAILNTRKRFAQVLLDSSRSSDYVAALDDETFCVLLEYTQLADALVVIERIKNKVVELQETNAMEVCNIWAGLTCSSSTPVSSLCEAGGIALSKAKSLGENGSYAYVGNVYST